MKVSTSIVTIIAAAVQISAVTARSWEWCAPDYTCNQGRAYGGAADCMDQDDCAQKAAPTFGDPYSNAGCGSGVYPRSCWVWTEN